MIFLLCRQNAPWRWVESEDALRTYLMFFGILLTGEFPLLKVNQEQIMLHTCSSALDAAADCAPSQTIYFCKMPRQGAALSRQSNMQTCPTLWDWQR
jgi:hypothetical protein